MSGTLTWVIVVLGLGVVIVRRRSIAVGLVTAQALVLVGFALADSPTGGELVAAAALTARAAVLAVLLILLITRTRESRPVRAGAEPLARAGLAVVLALVLTWLVPSLGLDSRDAERAVLALVGVALAMAITRRATLFHILAIVTVENALAFAALEQPGGSSLLVEVGVATDLVLLASVAAVFHDRIFAEFGTGDTRELRSLRD